MQEPELLLKHEDIVGEGPLWISKECRLYWIDIYGKKIHMLKWDSGNSESKTLPFSPGCIADMGRNFLLIAHDTSLSLLSWEDGSLKKLHELSEDSERVRYNDGKCDPSGRFICGTLDKYDELTRVLGQNLKIESTGPRGKLYCFSPRSMEPVILEKNITTSNGLAWNKEGSSFYYVDTPTRQIVKYDYDIDNGTIKGKNIFFNIPVEWGSPDGMTVDAEGNIWLALWDGWKVLKIDSNGKLVDELILPVKRPTSCIFAGPDLDTLVITSASMKGYIDDDDSELGGSLFYVKPGVKGIESVPAKYHFYK